jgi:hypothetical protein
LHPQKRKEKGEEKTGIEVKGDGEKSFQETAGDPGEGEKGDRVTEKDPEKREKGVDLQTEKDLEKREKGENLQTEKENRRGDHLAAGEQMTRRRGSALPEIRGKENRDGKNRIAK